MTLTTWYVSCLKQLGSSIHVTLIAHTLPGPFLPATVAMPGSVGFSAGPIRTSRTVYFCKFGILRNGLHPLEGWQGHQKIRRIWFTVWGLLMLPAVKSLMTVVLLLRCLP